MTDTTRSIDPRGTDRRTFVRRILASGAATGGISQIIKPATAKEAYENPHYEKLEPPYSTLPGQVHTEVDSVGGKPVDQDINARTVDVASDGETEFHISGSLDGPGKAGVRVNPGIQAIWTAPESAAYTVKADYVHPGKYDQQVWGENTDAVMSLEPTLAILPEGDDVIASKSTVDLEVGAETSGNPALQLLLNFLAKRLVFPHLGFVGKIIGHVVLHLLPSWGPKNSGTFQTAQGRAEGSLQKTFRAVEGTTYRVRLVTPGGFSGMVQQSDGGFSSQLAVNYKLTDFSVEEEPVPGGWGAHWWGQKLGNNKNTIDFERWGEDYWNNKLQTSNA